MALVDPLPEFAESSHCAVCSCSFGAFRRRHHCRACGRSLCSEHSSNQVALPQFGLDAPVRVCAECFNAQKQINTPKIPDEFNRTVAAVSELHLESDFAAEDESKKKINSESDDCSVQKSFECTCGMPLCICKAPEPEPPKVVTLPSNSPTVKTRKVSAVPVRQQQQPSSTTSMPSLFFASVQGNQQPFTRSYDSNGEGMREAIKNGDQDAVKDLLSKGVDPNYTDKQGMSLLHLAAVFNLTDISFMLLDAGASLLAKNPQGETPIDCAQTSLQYKLRDRLP